MARGKKLLLLCLDALTGLIFSLTLWLHFFQGAAFSWRRTAAVAVLALLFSGGSHFLRNRFLSPRLKTHSPWKTALLALLSLATAFFIMLIAPINPPPIALLLPKHNLRLELTGHKNPASTGAGASLLQFNSGLLDVSYNAFNIEGNWQRQGNTLTIEAPAVVQWRGPLLEQVFLAFQGGPDQGIIRIMWDGQETIFDLYSPQPQALYAYFSFPVPFWNLAISAILTLFSLGTLFLLFFSTFLNPPHPQPAASHRRFFWLPFAIPMLLIWSLYLLVFFPGVVNPDAAGQWQQVMNGQFSDWHPPFHTLTFWLLTRLWFSPAVVAVAQILALSLLSAWGLGMAVQSGVPSPAAWTFALLMALSPPDSTAIITLWKDVPYSLALFALFLLLYRILLTQGKWLSSPYNWVWLGLVGALVSLYRHNGLPVALAVLLALGLVYIRYWRQAAAAVALLLALYFGVRGPLYSAVGVEHNSAMLGNTIYLHHITAHLAAGTPLAEEQSAYLNQLYPLERWRSTYDCYHLVYFSSEFNKALFAQNAAVNRQIFWSLFMKNPWVNINHLLCSSALIWDPRSASMYALGIDIYSSQVSWVSPMPDGTVENSLLPQAVPVLVEVLRFSLFKPFWQSVIWRPATYLYLALLGSLVLTLRFRDPRWLLTFSPVLFQSAVLFLVNVSRDFRMQYAVYLIGFFSLALLYQRFPTMDAREEKAIPASQEI